MVEEITWERRRKRIGRTKKKIQVRGQFLLCLFFQYHGLPNVVRNVCDVVRIVVSVFNITVFLMWLRMFANGLPNVVRNVSLMWLGMSP